MWTATLTARPRRPQKHGAFAPAAIWFCCIRLHSHQSARSWPPHARPRLRTHCRPHVGPQRQCQRAGARGSAQPPGHVLCQRREEQQRGHPRAPEAGDPAEISDRGRSSDHDAPLASLTKLTCHARRRRRGWRACGGTPAARAWLDRFCGRAALPRLHARVPPGAGARCSRCVPPAARLLPPVPASARRGPPLPPVKARAGVLSPGLDRPAAMPPFCANPAPGHYDGRVSRVRARCARAGQPAHPRRARGARQGPRLHGEASAQEKGVEVVGRRGLLGAGGVGWG
jgi:hypothetical protein